MCFTCIYSYIYVHTWRYVPTSTYLHTYILYPIYVRTYVYTYLQHIRIHVVMTMSSSCRCTYVGTEALHMATLLTKEEGNLLVFDVPQEREEEFKDKLKKWDISSIPFMHAHWHTEICVQCVHRIHTNAFHQYQLHKMYI